MQDFPDTLETLRTLQPLLPASFPYPAGYALLAFARKAPKTHVHRLSRALAPITGLSSGQRETYIRLRSDGGTRLLHPTAASAATALLRGSLRSLSAPLRESVHALAPLMPPGFLPAFPTTLDALREEILLHSPDGRSTPFHQALDSIDMHLDLHVTLHQDHDKATQTRARAETAICTFVSLSAEAAATHSLSHLPQPLAAYARDFLDPSQPSPPPPAAPTGMLLAAAWTAPVTPASGGTDERRTQIVHGIRTHVQEARNRNAFLVIPILHGHFAMPDDDPDNVPKPRHPSLQLPSMLSAAGIEYRELHPDIDIYGQAFLPDLPPDATPDPALSPVILVRPANPEPDSSLNAMRATSPDGLYSAHADDLALSAALSVCSSATILRSDLAMGNDFQSRVITFRNGTHHLAPAQLELQIRNGLSSALGSLGPSFPVRISHAAILGHALERAPANHDDLIADLTCPFAASAAAQPQRNPPFRIAIHGNFPRSRQPASLTPRRQRRHGSHHPPFQPRRRRPVRLHRRPGRPHPDPHPHPHSRCRKGPRHRPPRSHSQNPQTIHLHRGVDPRRSARTPRPPGSRRPGRPAAPVPRHHRPRLLRHRGAAHHDPVHLPPAPESPALRQPRNPPARPLRTPASFPGTRLELLHLQHWQRRPHRQHPDTRRPAHAPGSSHFQSRRDRRRTPFRLRTATSRRRPPGSVSGQTPSAPASHPRLRRGRPGLAGPLRSP